PEGAEKSEAVEAKVEVEDPVEVLRQQNKTLQDEVKTLKDKLLRSYAEEENVRRIAQRDVAAAKEYANTKFAKSLLDVADNLERAIDVIDHEQRAEADPQFLNLLQGVEMTQKGLVKVFESHGISRFGAVGDVFDPSLHDALCNMPAPDKTPGTIGQLMKPGYKLKDRVIRAAEVATVA
ncbi:unnamed protein product, partial [Ectocarpus fasciculatus]